MAWLAHYIQVDLSEVKGPVMDRFAKAELFKHLGPEHVFFTAVDAFDNLSSP